MLTNRLVELAENNAGRIAAAAMERIRREKELAHMAELPDSELCDWAEGIVKNLQSWPGPDRDKSFAKRYDELGRRRYEESVPFHESIRALHILKRAIIDFVRNQGFGPTSLEIYSEKVLEDRINLFFDCLLYHAARGYYVASGRVPFEDKPPGRAKWAESRWVP